MARFFQALVVMSGGLAGCGRDVSSVEQTQAEGDSSASSSMGENGGSASATGSVVAGGAVTGIAVTGTMAASGGNGVVDTPTNGTGGASTLQGIAGDQSGSNPSPPMLIQDDPLAGPLPQRGPDECPPERWDCGELRSCAREQQLGCGTDFDGDIDTCVGRAEQACVCDAARPLSAADCASGEVFVCLHGTFAAEGDAGGTETLHFDCECVAPQQSCEAYCDEHGGVGGYYRACQETADVVLCGGCVWTGILR